ncbi:unnamed protein product [Vicia faba]|nr:unnamed protein product [Vicia faba]
MELGDSTEENGFTQVMSIKIGNGTTAPFWNICWIMHRAFRKIGDVMFWPLQASHCYLVRSYYAKIVQSSAGVVGDNRVKEALSMIWNAKVPSKVEEINHFFINCYCAKVVWHKIFIWLGLGYDMENNYCNHFM